MPVRKTPSNVPAPPILATGAPSLGITLRCDKSGFEYVVEKDGLLFFRKRK
jgi:hypothetical protein